MTISRITHSRIIRAALGVATLFWAGTASAQVTDTLPKQTVSYSADMTLSGSDGIGVNAKLFATPDAHRVELPTDQYGMMVSLIDRKAKTAHSFAKSIDGPLGLNAMQIDYARAADRLGADLYSDTVPIKGVTDIVNGQRCTVYTLSNSTACITPHGIIMRIRAGDGGVMTLSNVVRTAQADYLFRVPNGYRRIDARKGSAQVITAEQMQTPSQPAASGPVDRNAQMQNFIAKQAGKQTKKQIKKMTRKQIGNSLGGFLGGGIVGGTIGARAGDLVTGVVGDMLTGKEKAKADDAPATGEVVITDVDSKKPDADE